MVAFQWHPNLSIVACIYEDEQIGLFRIKHDTKKWLYYDALIDESIKKNESKEDDSSDESDRNQLESTNHKVIRLSWQNEGKDQIYELRFLKPKILSNFLFRFRQYAFLCHL